MTHPSVLLSCCNLLRENLEPQQLLGEKLKETLVGLSASLAQFSTSTLDKYLHKQCKSAASAASTFSICCCTLGPECSEYDLVRGKVYSPFIHVNMHITHRYTLKQQQNVPAF